MEFFSDFIITYLKKHNDKNNNDDIDLLIDNGVLKIHSSGLLYGLIEPEVDDYPDSCILLCYGAGTIYNSLLVVTDNFQMTNGKNIFLNVKVFIFQYFGKYGSKSVKILSGDEDYHRSIEISFDIIREFGIPNIKTIGHSFGCYGAAKYSTGISALICPFNANTDTFGICSSELNCVKTVEQNGHRKFFVLFGSDDDWISEKTISSFEKLENCAVSFYSGDHRITHNYRKYLKAVIYCILF